jgi:hypothetical protein
VPTAWPDPFHQRGLPFKKTKKMARLMEFEPRTWRLSTTGLTTAPMIRLCKNDSTFPLIYVRASKIAKSYAGGWVRTSYSRPCNEEKQTLPLQLLGLHI